MDSAQILLKLLSCPVNWSSETAFDDWGESVLQFHWEECLMETAVDREEIGLLFFELTHLEVAVAWTDEEELKQIAKNIELRRHLAVTQYNARAGRLSSIRFLTPAEHGKHFARGASEGRAISRRAPSTFSTNHTSDNIRKAFWNWFFCYFDAISSYEEYEELMTPDSALWLSPMGGLWRKFIDSHRVRVCMDAIKEVGVARGAPTSIICFDLHLDARHCPCYPVSRSDAERIMTGSPIELVDALHC